MPHETQDPRVREIDLLAAPKTLHGRIPLGGQAPETATPLSREDTPNMRDEPAAAKRDRYPA
jgi:hypothetical protein